jgi:uncharacterized protein (DUF1697 family)
MEPYVVLLRGINVGGNNILPMKELRELLMDLGCEDVATYIQSGNAVFRHTDDAASLSVSIAAAIESRFDFRPAVMVLQGQVFSAVAEDNPYAADNVDAKLLHTWFLQEPATQPNLERLRAIQANDEEFVLTDAALYLYAPSGIGRSKWAAEAEKCLGVQATARNSRSIGKIGGLLADRS